MILLFVPSFTSVTLWDHERRLLKREEQQGYYVTSSFYAAKTLAMLPMEIGFAALTSLLVYFVVGYQTDAGKFFTYWLILAMALILSATLGEICAIWTPRSDYGVILLTVIALILLSFTGFLVSDTPVYFRWISRISYINYGTAAMMQNELQGLKLKQEDG